MPSKILAIHDRARSQSDLKHCLEPAHELTVCDNIELVKEQLSKMCKAETNREPYDLILCAIHLNDSNSGNVIDFLRWTKKHSRLRDVPFLLLCTRQGLLIEKYFKDLCTASGALGAAGFLMVDDFSSLEFRQNLEQFLPNNIQPSTVNNTLTADVPIALS